MKRVMTIDKGPLKVSEAFVLRGTNRRIIFKRLEDNTIVVTYKTLVDRKKRIISPQCVRLGEQAAEMTIHGLLKALGADTSKDGIQIMWTDEPEEQSNEIQS